jgi:putative transcriptional regulator
MKKVRVTLNLTDPSSVPMGRADLARIDATTEEEIARQAAADDAEAMQDAVILTR